jgi:hypothetical protein
MRRTWKKRSWTKMMTTTMSGACAFSSTRLMTAEGQVTRNAAPRTARIAAEAEPDPLGERPPWQERTD